MSKLYELVCTQAHYIPHDLELCCEEVKGPVYRPRDCVWGIDHARALKYLVDGEMLVEVGEDDDAS